MGVVMCSYEVITGDCLEVMAGMDAESVDAVVSDPPYGLSFMGKDWDKGVPGEAFWAEALRVAKPGAHLLAFGGTRMVHRLAVAIEDAGWEIRDRIHWVYGSGFPKSHDVSKAIDKAAGVEFTSKPASGVGFMNPDGRGGYNTTINQLERSGDSTPEAQQWYGWGTALKPAVEPIIMARKPFKGTVAANVLEYGTGAINVDGCRVDTNGETPTGSGSGSKGESWNSFSGNGGNVTTQGRWPANLIHDGSEEATEGMGDAARYFYCPKASKADREAGLAGLAGSGCYGDFADKSRPTHKNHHPTVKPTELMAYLCRLVTPPGGTVLDPFNGSGSTGKAAIREGFNYIGIELNPEYADIARQRIAHEAGDAPLYVEAG